MKGLWKYARGPLTLGIIAIFAGPAAVAQGRKEPGPGPKLYVPYKDIAAAIGPVDQAVLMERVEFDQLLKAAASAATADARALGQVTRADYTGVVSGDKLRFSGTLELVSLSDQALALPMPFGGAGLTQALLDGKPAPLNYSRAGKLMLVVTGKGSHKLTVVGSATLTELRGGGMQFSVVLPTPVAGTMKLSLPGDQEAHATVPVAATVYDRKSDATTVELTIGGHGAVSVALLGNGRQEDRRAILLGESVSSVTLTPTGQLLSCLYTVQVLRRGVRELVFSLPQTWTVTDISCPSLVKWAVTRTGKTKTLKVRLRTASRGTKALHVKACAARQRQDHHWQGPRMSLHGAAYQRGYWQPPSTGSRSGRKSCARPGARTSPPPPPFPA